MNGLIRKFEERDYPQVIAITNAVDPAYPELEEDYRHFDTTRDPKCAWGRFVYEEDGQLKGFGGFSQSAWTYHPRLFWSLVKVHPDHRGRGIGRAIYDFVMKKLEPLDPMVILTDCQETKDESLRFLARRGFVEVMREEESIIDLADFEPEEFTGDLERIAREGIEIKALAELVDEPDLHRHLYDLDMLLSRDVPTTGAVTSRDFDSYCQRQFQGKRLFPEGYMIAIREGRFVAFSNFENPRQDGKLYTDLTGVRRDLRKRGLATALKVRALSAAKAEGFKEVLTWNEENNKGMLGINHRLGFKPRPAWLELRKVIDAPAFEAYESENEVKEKEKVTREGDGQERGQ